MAARRLAPGAEGFRVRERWGRRREREERRVRGAELGEVRREGKACPERGKRESRPGARGAVPGVELLAIGECPHVVVAHEVAAAHGARALIRHEAPLDLQLRFGTQAQARHRRRLTGHPEQQQKQRRRRGPPAPGPEHHRGRRGEERVRTRSGRGRAELGRRGSGLGAAAFANVEKIPGPPRDTATTPSTPAPRPHPSEGRSRGRVWGGRACCALHHPRLARPSDPAGWPCEEG